MQKIPLTYLVFDDEDDELNQNKLNVKIAGMSCDVIFFNPNNYYDADNDEFNVDNFKEDILEICKGKQIHLVASDWNMLKPTSNYPEVNALQIMQILIEINPKYKKVQYLIYSGNPKQVSTILMEKIKEELDNEVEELIYSKELLSMLLELKIKFSPRGSRFDEISTLINSSKTISLIVLNSLSAFEENVIHNTGNSTFDGKNIKDLLNLISQNNDLGLKFIREFIELSIANYSEINVN